MSFLKNKIKNVADSLSKIQKICCLVISVLILAGAAFLFSTVSKAKTYNVDFSAIRRETAGGTDKLMLHGLALRKGIYDLSLGYFSDTPAKIEIALENDFYVQDDMPAAPAGNTKAFQCKVRLGTDRGRVDISYPEGGTMSLAYITISSDKPLYYDNLLWGIILILLIPGVWMCFYFYNNSDHKLSLILTIMLVLVQLVPFMFSPDIPVGVDSKGHMMRIEGIFYGLLDGQYPVVVYPEWNNSYGQIGVLYPNVFLYIPALFRLLGMSQLGTLRIHMLVTIVTAALIALASARSIFKREWQIGLCVLLLSLEDIRLMDMLFRGRIGGALIAEMFLPLVAAGLIEIIYGNRRKWYLIAYGMAGIFCCHITSATVACIAVFLFLVFSVKKLRDPELLKNAGKAALLFFGLIIGTFVCFLTFYFGEWSEDALRWRDFMETLWRPGTEDSLKWISVFITGVLCYVALIVLAWRGRLDKIKGRFAYPLLFSATILAWMSTAAFPWAFLRRIPIVKYYTDMLQSGDRFLSVAATFFVFCLPALLEAVATSVEGRRTYKSRTTMTSLVTIAILSVVNLVSNEYRYFAPGKNSIMYYDSVIGDIEIGVEDYLPKGTESEWYLSDSGYISNEDEVTSLAYAREGTYVYYSYTCTTDGAYAEFPKFYYNGYVAKDEMAEDVPVYMGDRNRIRVYLKKTDTPAIVRLWYHVPWYMTFFTAVSLGLWIGSLMFIAARVTAKIE